MGWGWGCRGCGGVATVRSRSQVGFSKQLLCQVSARGVEPGFWAFLAAPGSSAPLGACEMDQPRPSGIQPVGTVVLCWQCEGSATLSVEMGTQDHSLQAARMGADTLSTRCVPGTVCICQGCADLAR